MLLVITSLINEVATVVVLSPVVFRLSAATHVNVAGTDDVNAMFNAVPLQIVSVEELVITGAGLTTTVIVCGSTLPHVPVVAVGVTV